MKKLLPFICVILFFAIVSIACGSSTSTGGDSSINATQIALSVQQTSLAQGQNAQAQPPASVPDAAQPTYTSFPTYTVQAPQQPEQPQEEQPQQAQPTATFTLTPTVTQTATQEMLFLDVTTDQTEFTCCCSPDPLSLTITVEMSDVDRGAALFWRLRDKVTDTKLDWELVDMHRAGGKTRTYTFDADIPGGTANFTFPMGVLGESWFEFQIISNDGLDRTEVFVYVTFFPCQP